MPSKNPLIPHFRWGCPGWRSALQFFASAATQRLTDAVTQGSGRCSCFARASRFRGKTVTGSGTNSLFGRGVLLIIERRPLCPCDFGSVMVLEER